MKNALNIFDDRRKFQRKKIKINARLNIGIHLKGTGYTQDISLEGARIRAPELFAFFKPEQAHVFEGADVTISFPKESFSIHGKVLRIDVLKEELAIRIADCSNQAMWEMYCS